MENCMIHNSNSEKGITHSWILFRKLTNRSLRHKSYVLFAVCILISSIIMSTIGFFSLAVKTTLNHDISKFLGAPLVISSRRALEEQWWNSVELPTTTSNLKKISPITTASFTYGIVGKNGYHSIALKAVSNNYPAQDFIELAIETNQGLQNSSSTAIDLLPSQAWLDTRALAELGLTQGDKVQIGQREFIITAEIIFEPDRLTQLQHVLPRIMINMTDLESVGLDLDNGRGDFRYLFNQQPSVLKSIETQLPSLTKQSYKVLKPTSGQHPFALMAERSEKMLGLVMVLIMLMCGSAAALLADTAMKRFIIPATILRCMGLQRKSINRTLMMQLTLLAFLSSALGTLISWLLQPLLKEFLKPHLIIKEMVFNFQIPLITLAITTLTILAFIYPRLRAAGSVTIVSVLQGQMQIKKSFWLSSLAAVFAIILLLWYFSDNTKLTIYLSIGVISLVFFSLVFGWIISKITMQFHHLTKGYIKIALRSIGRNPQKYIAPMATISLAVMGFLIIDTLRGSFLNTFQMQMLKQDGNVLYSRLPADKAKSFENFIHSKNLQVMGKYPTVSAQLITINGLDIDKALTQESDTRSEARSPVRLSWSKNMPTNNRMLSGQWPQSSDDGVSVESEVMSDLGLEIGDQLGFDINGSIFNTTIKSRREFKSGSSQMMFWFMFSPDALQNFSHQYMGGISMDLNKINTENNSTLRELNASFPEVLFTDLQHVIKRTSDIMHALMKVMSSILFLLLVAASTVIMAGSYVSTGHSQHNLMRALGITKPKLMTMSIIQQGIIGLVSCLVGILGAQLISGLLFKELFALTYVANLQQNILITSITTSCFILFGLFLNYYSTKKPLLINQMKADI
jgi:putative ABC transport system permease protein